MINGTFTYYVIQTRTIFSSSKSVVSKCDLRRLIPESKRHEWISCGADAWGRSMNPHVGEGNNWRPKYPLADKQWYECKRQTGWNGWFNVNYALSALKRVRKDDDEGMYDAKSSYGKKEGVIRHEFRIVKVVQVYQRDETELTIDDLLESRP